MSQEAYVFPTSFAQQRLWFVDQLDPNSSLYNILETVGISGPLNVSILHRAIEEIVARHEALRTTFTSVNGSPMQVIVPTGELALPVVDLTGLSEAEREEKALQLAREEAEQPFDLVRGPLLRTKLLRLAEEQHVMLLVTHHIVFDGWSTGVFFRELAVLYEVFSVGKPSPLPGLPIQYADYAVWQREQLTGEAYAKQLAYWKEQLKGAPAVLHLPADRPRPAAQSFRGAHQYMPLPKDLAESLGALAQREGVTLFMLLLAAFQTLLARYTAQDEIMVGSASAGRSQLATENLIGCFINTLVLRTDVSGDPSFRELLRRVREVTLEAYAHQDVPFEKLVEELQPERSLSYSPLFQVLFMLQNAPRQALEPAGQTLTLNALTVDNGTSKFDLKLEIVGKADGLSCLCEYSTALFDASTIRQMMGHLEVLLASVVANPDERISRLPLLTAAERHQLLVAWNNTQSDIPRDKCIHELFEAQVEQTPETVAVVFEDKQVTYSELNRRANQLAHRLRALGVRPEVRVGILIERSLEMVVGLLGILKAGGTYVPLDPSYPKERVAFMLEDAAVAVLVTQAGLVESIQAHHTQVVRLDADWKAIAEESTENPASGVTPENLAYVIYTSGSTGRPKGVQIAHNAVVNFLTAVRRQPGLTAQDVLLAITTLSFDIAGLELYLPLSVGARVVVASRDVATDGTRLQELLAGVTVMQATPATWRLLLEAGWQGSPQLKILCGGEALSRELADKLLDRSASVWNMYGPTETTIWSTISKVEPEKGPVPIGRPLANTHIYILDQQLQPVPRGVSGELYIGGDGLARGYLNRPELTAERFIPNPFSSEPGARLYKTGDLTRYLPDGSIEYLGRLDHQVKIRGFRIELGEVEAVISEHPAVQTCVVLAREDVPSEKRLVAYLVAAQQGPPPSVSELRGYLKERLPDYMVPSVFVVLEKLPLTPNGKVDRRALPAPDAARPELGAAYVSPRSAVEEVIASIWAEALGIEKVGVADNFFELGGHSLLATQVVSRIEEAFAVEVSLRSLFESPTVAALVESMTATNEMPEEDLNKIARVLIQLDQLSDEEARMILAEDS